MTDQQANSVTNEEKVFSVFAYFGVLCLVSLALKKDSEFVKFHVKQGIILFIIETIFALANIVPVLGNLFYLLVMLICGILAIIGMIQAIMGNKWDIPFIADWAKKITV